MSEKTIAVPHSREAEEAVIGSVFINPEIFHELSLILSDGREEFYIHRLKFIWNAFEVLRSNRQPIDLLTVSATLERQGMLNEITPAYITSLVNAVPSSLNAPSYAQIIHGFHIRRKLLQEANNIAERVYDLNKPIDEIKNESQKGVMEVVALGDSEHTHQFGEIFKQVYNRVLERRDLPPDAPLPGIRTGWIDLDGYLHGGWQDEKLYGVANRPGGGKTSFLCQTGTQAAKLGKTPMLFSLEMNANQIVERVLSQEHQLMMQGIRSGRFNALEWNRFQQSRNLKDLNIIIDDTPRITPELVFSKVEVQMNLTGVDLILLDYLGLMRCTQRFAKKSDEINYLAQELKLLARYFKVPVIAAMQMNRNIEYKSDEAEPVLSDLKEGGDADCDTVIFLHHFKDKDGDITSSIFKIEKNRDGAPGKIPVVWRGEYTRFEPAARL